MRVGVSVAAVRTGAAVVAGRAVAAAGVEAVVAAAVLDELTGGTVTTGDGDALGGETDAAVERDELVTAAVGAGVAVDPVLVQAPTTDAASTMPTARENLEPRIGVIVPPHPWLCWRDERRFPVTPWCPAPERRPWPQRRQDHRQNRAG